MNKMQKKALLYSAVAIISVYPGIFPANAQVTAPAGAAPPSSELGEIVVTANKRAQNLQDVGIAVTALNNNALNLIQKSDLTQIAKVVPSLQVQQYSPTLTIFNIRGVSQNDFGDYQEAPIAFYNDEVYIASLGAIAGQMFDLERVEVLRGPQGTLFGRNATGGLVQAITAKPTNGLEGFGALTLGSYGQIGSEAAISGPLSDRVRARLSFTNDRYHGYIDNTDGRSQGNRQFYAGRAQLEADVGDRGKLRLKAELLRDVNERGTGYRNIPAGANADCLGTFSTADGIGGEACYPYLPFLPNYGYVPSSDPFKQSYNLNSFFSRTYWNLTGRYEHDLGFATLTSITNYQNLRKRYTDDADASPFTVLTIDLQQRFYQMSQELRLNGKVDRLNWTLGAYGLKLHSINPQQITLPPLGYFADISARSRTSSFAMFGQGEYKLNDYFTAIVGGRYSWDWKHFDLAVHTDQLDGNFQPITYDYFLNRNQNPDLAKQVYKNYSGKVELDFKPSKNALLYVSINRGTKGGGFNVPYVIQAASPPAQTSLVYKQEVLTNYEGGFKLKLLDNKVTFNGSAFHYRYDNYQAFSYFNGNSSITNQPARVTGFELELAARPTSSINVSAFLSHLAKAEVKNVVLPSGRIVDTDMPQAPKWSVGGSVAFTTPIENVGTLRLSTSWKYDSTQSFTTLNAPIDQEPSRVVGDVRAGFTFADDHWETSVGVNNVTNKNYRVFNTDNSFIGLGHSTYARPRWVSGTITYRFGG